MLARIGERTISEDLTQNLPLHSFEGRVLADFTAIRGELAAIRGDIKDLDEKIDRLDAKVEGLEPGVDALEEKIDRPLQETRPVWEDVQLRLDRLQSKFDIVLEEHTELRLGQKLLGRRVTQIEGRRTE
jgi:predicted nuclease with TOPRIM domain